MLGQPAHVFFGLLGDADQRLAFGLGLDDAAGLAGDEEQVVAGAGGELVLADGDADAGTEGHRGAILQEPTCQFEKLVDSVARGGFGCRQSIRWSPESRHSHYSTH